MSNEENNDESKVKKKFSSGLSAIGDKAKETAKKGLDKVETKTKEVAAKGVQKMEDKAQEIISSALEMENTSNNQPSQNKKNSANKTQTNFGQNLSRTSRGLENQVATWQGWFWSTMSYLFIIIISFAISSTDSRFKFLPIVLLIGFPFFLYYAIINSIPEIKIGRRVIFSRKDLSLRRQLSFTSQVARAFSREMIENSPVGAFFIFAFLILLVYIILSPFLGA